MSGTPKRDMRLKESGPLTGFKFENFWFPSEPKTAFYDWLYITSPYEHREPASCPPLSVSQWDPRPRIPHRITGGDSFPGQYRKPAGVSVMLNIDEPAEADRIFTALAKGGEVEMPIQETFWALRHAHRPVRNSVRHQLRRAGRGMSVLATRRACHNKPSNHARSLIQDRSHSLRR